jgi:hypothetical protein
MRKKSKITIHDFEGVGFFITMLIVSIVIPLAVMAAASMLVNSCTK